MLQKIISQTNSSITDISTPTQVLTCGVDSVLTSFFWFTPYRSSDFPEIECDKTYFFLYSTDHNQNFSQAACYWGKGNNLDLSDFQEVGLVVTGYLAETPFLYRFPDADRPIFLYYHTVDSNPINLCGGQETNLITTSGGALHTATWTQEANPMGCQGDGQNHTGYIRFWDIEGVLTGNHSFIGAAPADWQRATTSDGLSFTTLNTYINYDVFLETGRSWALSWMEVFNYNNKYYAFVNSMDNNLAFSLGDFPTAGLHLVEINADLEIVRLIKTLNNNSLDQAFSFFIEGNTAHFYRQSGRTDYPDTYYGYLAYSNMSLLGL